MRRARITEKKLANKRYKKTEEKLLKAFFEDDTHLSMGQLARKIGVTRSTAYRHHRTTWEIVPDYQAFILRKYAGMVRRTLKRKGVTTRALYVQMLVFLIRYRQIVAILIKDGNYRVVERMVEKLQPRMMVIMRLPRGAEKILDLYVGDVTRLILRWCERGFGEDEIEAVVSDIVYLTRNTRVYLRPLLGT